MLARFKTVHIDDIDIAYQEAGSGAALLLIFHWQENR
jgi:hypothetical protein